METKTPHTYKPAADQTLIINAAAMEAKDHGHPEWSHLVAFGPCRKTSAYDRCEFLSDGGGCGATWHEHNRLWPDLNPARFKEFFESMKPHGLTNKAELADAMGLMAFDTALPQGWVDEFTEAMGESPVTGTHMGQPLLYVWSYDHSKIFGRPVPLNEASAYRLIDFLQPK